jgi:hypothetical protein
MKFRAFWLTVPSPARISVGIILGCGLLAGPIAYLLGNDHLAPGMLAGLALGILISTWVVCLGFVYADAQRRSMPAVLWTLVAALVPNLLGFLLYFVMRQPPSVPCSHCGQMIKAGQRFCSWCGQMETMPPGGQSGINPGPTV